MIALDNYSVHTSQTVITARPALAAASVELVYLARYCPEQSDNEPVWNDVKQHHILVRSFRQVAELENAMDGVLARKAVQQLRARKKRTKIRRRAA